MVPSRKPPRLAALLTLTAGFLISAAAVWWSTPVRPRALLPEGSDVLGLSADGQILATLREGRVNFWELSSGEEAGSIPDDLTGWSYWEFELSPRGRWLTSSGDGRLKVWEVPSGREHVAVKVSPRADFRAGPTFSPDGRWLAFRAEGPARKSYRIKVWDLQAGREEADLPGAPSGGLVFSPDGGLLAFEHWEPVPQQPPAGVVLLYDNRTGEQRPLSDDPPGLLRTLAFSPDGRTLVTGQSQGWMRDPPFEVQLWDLTGCKCRGTWEMPRVVRGLTFSPDGSRLLVTIDSLVWGPEALVIDPSDPDAPPKGPVASADRLSPDGRLLACGWDRPYIPVTLREFPSLREKVQLRPPREGERMYLRGFSPDGKVLAVRGDGPFGEDPDADPPPAREGSVHLYATETGERLVSVPAVPASGVWFTPDGKAFAVEGPGKRPTVWDLPPAKPWPRILGWWAFLAAGFALAGFWMGRPRKVARPPEGAEDPEGRAKGEEGVPGDSAR